MPFDAPIDPFKLPMPPSALLLTEALSLIQQGWVKCSEARDVYHRKVSPTSDDAHRFCSIGAIKSATARLGLPREVEFAARLYLERAIGMTHDSTIERWNDRLLTRKWHVTGAFYSAIFYATRDHYARIAA